MYSYRRNVNFSLHHNLFGKQSTNPAGYPSVPDLTSHRKFQIPQTKYNSSSRQQDLLLAPILKVDTQAHSETLFPRWQIRRYKPIVFPGIREIYFKGCEVLVCRSIPENERYTFTKLGIDFPSDSESVVDVGYVPWISPTYIIGYTHVLGKEKFADWSPEREL